MTPQEVQALEDSIHRITDKAEEFGLDFFPMRYEICPSDIIYTFGAYAMPIRFSHWSFGKAFHREKTSYDYGLSKIYELVINSDPCYAFLLDSNSLIQNKLIAAHVLGHSDFFKHNYRFAHTDRQMVWSMAAFASRVREYEMEYGRARVERFLDAVLSIQEHVDPQPGLGEERREEREQRPGPRPAAQETPYDDLWALDRRETARPAPVPEDEGGVKRQARDVLLFILEKAPDLKPWQRDVISSIRKESLYFRPQMETKIMNEGWASFWHAQIMRNIDLTPDEAMEFARMHAGVLAPQRHALNPYHLGYKLFEDIDKRLGRERIFEVREVDNDVSFIRSYLTKELVEELDLYMFGKVGDRWEVTANSRLWEKVRDGICSLIANCGFPYLYAEDHDWGRRGELCLRHGYEGTELDTNYLVKTLPHVYHIWTRPVHLETVEDGKAVRYSCGGAEVERKLL